MKVEYRIVPITRFQVTRHFETEPMETAASPHVCSGGTEQKGIYDNRDVAFEVAYALCKEEHQRLGYPPGDERIQYPRPIIDNTDSELNTWTSKSSGTTYHASSNGVGVLGGSMLSKTRDS